MSKIFLVLCVLTVLFFGTLFSNETNPSNPSLELLGDWLSGSFSSQEQATQDSSYFDIRLQMVPIWKNRNDGIWMYVEQAAAGNLTKPYRQRVYHLFSPEEGKYISEVYTFNKPLRFAGAWNRKNPLGPITVDSLSLREGCSIFMYFDSEKKAFVGGIEGNECSSSLRGATYATSEVIVTKDSLVSWDQGFDAEGNQVWGAEKGGYVFLKKKSTKKE